jgi:hypothetical protein
MYFGMSEAKTFKRTHRRKFLQFLLLFKDFLHSIKTKPVKGKNSNNKWAKHSDSSP